MAITRELTPYVAASLAAQARARGVSLDAYVRNLIEAQAVAEAGPPQLHLAPPEPHSLHEDAPRKSETADVLENGCLR
jgi:hypothetical protein